MRILGLDVGTVRVGVALSDELGLTAQPLTVVSLRHEESGFRELVRLAETYQVEEIVCGLPINMNGTIGSSAERVRAFIEKLGALVRVPIQEWDERLTTAQAERVLIEGGVRREKRKEVVDKVAAVLILQGFLDWRRNRKA